MTTEENTELVLSWFEALVQGDPDRAVGLLHSEFRYFLTNSSESEHLR